ncbi:hypothetical protein LB507_010357 [Fusarium sp. FIESC RH6]|nr:hypothetical protein LB507_010357 [Fusarium sp. FIESC RH6]
MPRFKYISLRPLEVRLLELHPGLAGYALAGTITHKYFPVEGDEIPQFEALSYHWGDQSDPVSLSLSRCQPPESHSSDVELGSLDIGRNLASALQALRLQDRKRILWCDSICINQQDLHERAAQVQRMKDIYRYAKSVVVWLGPDTSWSMTAMDTLRWAADQIDTASLDFSLGRDRFTYKSTADEVVTKTFDALPLTTTQWLALEQLVGLQWHRRLWTFQEIVLADQKACVVKLGKDEMPWITFRDAVNFTVFSRALPQNCFIDETTVGPNAELLSGRAIICSMNMIGKYSWFFWISISRSYECTDPRDRVYALQGLVAPNFARSITPDYTKSSKEVFMSVCLQDLEQKMSLEFLELANATSGPSWVADLGRSLSSLTLDSHATPFSPASVQLIEPGLLEVAGISCDVLSCDPIPLAERLIMQTAIEYREQLLDIIRAFSTDDAYQDDGHLDKLIMALTYGSVRDFSMQKLQPPEPMSLHSLEDWRWKIRRWLSGSDDSMEDLKSYWWTDRQFTLSLPPGNTAIGIAKTKNGDFIRVPTESRDGDIIAVFLGLSHSIVLRPRPTGYLVLGTCYHPGLAQGNAILGDDLHGWEPLWDRKYSTYAFHKEGQPLRRSDPRLDGVPMVDGYVQRVVEDGVVGWAKEGYPLKAIDPRLSEEALKRRGFPIERFRLV